MTPPGVAASGLGDLLVRVAGAWSWRPAVLLVVGALAVLYVRGWSRLHRIPRTRGAAPGWRLAVYLAGLASVILALCSPLELMAELSFTAHMIQHQLLIMWAPPLLAPGERRSRSSLWGLPPRLRRRVGALVSRPGPVRRVLAHAHLDARGRRALHRDALGLAPSRGLYEAALRYPMLHDIEHLTFFGTAVLFWWPIVNPAPRFRRLTSGVMYGARIGYLILATAQNTLLGAVLGLSERVFYPSYAAAPRLLADWNPVDDQAFGGGVMWSGSHMFLLAVLDPSPPGDGRRGAKGGCTGPPHRVGFAQSMLDIGIQELLVVMVLALLIFGPDKLPELGQAARPGHARVPPGERRVPLDRRAEPPDQRGRHLLVPVADRAGGGERAGR